MSKSIKDKNHDSLRALRESVEFRDNDLTYIYKKKLWNFVPNSAATKLVERGTLFLLQSIKWEAGEHSLETKAFYVTYINSLLLLK